MNPQPWLVAVVKVDTEDRYITSGRLLDSLLPLIANVERTTSRLEPQATGHSPWTKHREVRPNRDGRLLVASSMPGVAMKGNAEQAMGAVVGKAMEPLEEGTGEIMAQVTLR